MRSISLLPQHIGSGPYQPVAADVELLPETGDRQASLANLERLCETRIVITMLAVEGGVLVVFETGEVYVAIDFGGEELARFASEHWYGEFGIWLRVVRSLDPSWRGLYPVPMDLVSEGPT